MPDSGLKYHSLDNGAALRKLVIQNKPVGSQPGVVRHLTVPTPVQRRHLHLIYYEGADWTRKGALEFPVEVAMSGSGQLQTAHD